MGAGAIGSLFGGYMALYTDEEITLFGREKHVNAIRKNGLYLSGVKGEFKIKNVKAHSDINEVEKSDLIFVTTKAYDTRNIILEARAIITPNTSIVSLQNGLGTEKIIREEIKKTDKIFRATTTNGALFKEPGRVIHTGFGSTIIGGTSNKYENELALIVSILNKAGFNAQSTDNIEKLIWKKIMVNVGINALGALLNVTNGLIPQKIPEYIIKKMLEEAILVAKKEGISLDLQEAYESFIDVCKKTKNNRNSMLQDIDKGKRTEIDYINGRIARLAEKHGLSAPYNELITILIKGIE
ncbi:MAG: ketopantoate reductase family protein [Candidatus Helarchaeota archaeon]